MPPLNEPTHRCAFDAAHAWIGAADGRMVRAQEPGQRGITLIQAKGACQEDTPARFIRSPHQETLKRTAPARFIRSPHQAQPQRSRR